MQENLEKSFGQNAADEEERGLPTSQVLVDFGTDPKAARHMMTAHLEENGMKSTSQTPSGAEFVPDLNLLR